MDSSLKNNDIKFNVISKALDSCDYLQHQLNHVEQLNSSFIDNNMTSLIKEATEISSMIKNDPFKYVLIESLPDEVQELISLYTKLDVYTDDPTGHYDAIQILELIDHLHRKYVHEIPMLAKIHEQSEKQRECLVSNLCDRLEYLNESSLDEVTSIVTSLLKCGNFSGRDLRLKYLQARDNWFNNACEEKSSSFDDVVLVYSKGLPMIFNEYKSIFCDSSEILNLKLMRLSSSDSTKEDAAIINSWLLLKTFMFISSLEEYLKTIIQSKTQTKQIGDTMVKCFELTDWLAKIGFDFSSHLKPLFSSAILEEVRASITKATTKFEFSFTTIASKSIESLLLPVEDEILRISSIAEPLRSTIPSLLSTIED